MRCFIAIIVPEDISARIDKAFGLKAKEKHITLAFLGNITEDDEKKAELALEALSWKCFEITLKGTGSFGSRVFFVSVSNADELSRLANAVRKSLDAFGIGYDKKEFVPHVTIARNAAFAKKANSATDFGSFLCTEIRLRQSIPSPEGYTYKDLFVKRLKH